MLSGAAAVVGWRRVVTVRLSGILVSAVPCAAAQRDPLMVSEMR